MCNKIKAEDQIRSIEYTWQKPYIIVSLTLRVKSRHNKYFRHETALYHRRGRRQDNRSHICYSGLRHRKIIKILRVTQRKTYQKAGRNKDQRNI
ncbi:hypothetical protein T05_5984 [Trichinella murrelli]|uniref:Uncharacterized protein n=1 Tax=Trichinella murrelli TaxID=144512 RepID=A0A0V0TXX6_9BILA|nr:hypothetical protein T05_5984 [Trichinella murrelli]